MSKNKRICICGHPEDSHRVSDKPALGITHLCGANLCGCERFQPVEEMAFEVTVTSFDEKWVNYEYPPLSGSTGRKWFPDVAVGQIWEMTTQGSLIRSCTLVSKRWCKNEHENN